MDRSRDRGAVSSKGQNAVLSRLSQEFNTSRIMSAAVIEIEGVEVEVVSHAVCERGGAHRELVSAARLERRTLGHDVDNSMVLCLRCLRAIPLKS